MVIGRKKQSPPSQGDSAQISIDPPPHGHQPRNREKISVFLRIPTLALPKSGEVEGIHPPLRSFTGTPLQVQLYSIADFLSNHNLKSQSKAKAPFVKTVPLCLGKGENQPICIIAAEGLSVELDYFSSYSSMIASSLMMKAKRTLSPRVSGPKIT